MNKEWAMKWVEALRSGKYTQGKGMLETLDGRNCCLGILCRIAGLEPVVMEGTKLFGSSGTFLPEEIRDKMDLYEINGRYRTKEVSLAELNDDGISFEEIADIIEKNYEKL